MTDDRAALAALAADTRAVLEDAVGRGVRFEAGEAPLQPAAEPAETDQANGSWSAIAAGARAAQPAGAAALQRVRDDLGDCQRCALARGRRTIVFGVGSAEADLVVVGEGPGYHEDQRGEPFVGPAGEMLDRMLINVLGLQRAEVYILNVVKCRPPKNRNPLPAEVATCIPFLHAQIEAIRPRLLLVLGAVAFRAVFEVKVGIMRNRGNWRSYRDIPAMPTLHPAYLLRNPADKRLVFEDLKAVRVRYDALGGRR